MINKYYYKKDRRTNYKKIIKILSLCVFGIGLFISLYIFIPLLYWQAYIKPHLSDASFLSPVPASSSLLGDFFSGMFTNNSINAQTWFPTFKTSSTKPPVDFYKLSIPKLGIKNAVVSNVDNDLAKHLVAYEAGTIPPNKGNVVIFGHSTILQWFNPEKYTTIFTDIYKLKPGDKIFIQIQGKKYEYSVYNSLIVDPSDTAVLNQNYNNSYLTLVTCTPPGTIWKRLIIQAKLVKN